MYCGTPYLCLSVKDLDTSRQFYEALGMAVTEEVPGKRVILREGHFSLTLMPFLTENLLNFRGADVFAVHDFLQREGFELDGSRSATRRSSTMQTRTASRGPRAIRTATRSSSTRTNMNDPTSSAGSDSLSYSRAPRGSS